MAPVESFLGRSETAVRTVLAFATLVGGGVYGLTYLGANIFYSRFGLKPEDVGLSQGSLIARSLTNLGFFALTGAILILYGLFGWFIAESVNRWIARPVHRAIVWTNVSARLNRRLRSREYRLGWLGAVVFSSLIFLSFGVRYETPGWGRWWLTPIFAVPLGVAFRNSSGSLGTRPFHRAVPVGVLILAVVLLMLSYYVTVNSAARLAISLEREGHLDTERNSDDFFRSALGLRSAQVEAEGLSCAVLLGTSGTRVWVLDQTVEDGYVANAVRSVDAESMNIQHLAYDLPPRCWRLPGDRVSPEVPR